MTAYPRVEAYLRALPEGLESHPERQTKGSVVRQSIANHPVTDTSGLPDALAELLRSPPSASAWVPEATANAVYLSLADYHRMDAAEYESASYLVNSTLFRSPLYRALMMVSTPQRLMRSAARRWTAFHRGTDLHVDLDEGWTRVSIDFPPGLFPNLVGLGLTASMKAGIEASRGRAVRSRLVEWTHSRGVAEAVWD